MYGDEKEQTQKPVTEADETVQVGIINYLEGEAFAPPMFSVAH